MPMMTTKTEWISEKKLRALARMIGCRYESLRDVTTTGKARGAYLMNVLHKLRLDREDREDENRVIRFLESF